MHGINTIQLLNAQAEEDRRHSVRIRQTPRTGYTEFSPDKDQEAPAK